MKQQSGTSYWVGKGLRMRAANILVELEIGTLTELRGLTPHEVYTRASPFGCGRATLLDIAACAGWRLDEDAVAKMIRNRYKHSYWPTTRAREADGQSAEN